MGQRRMVWGIVGMTVGLLAALQLAWPELNVGPYLHFGRIRPVHTNAVIFGFTLGAVFAGSYYGLQRLCRVRMFSDTLSRINLWGWNAIIVAAALSLLSGHSTSKEYAELEWPLDIAITVVWVVYAVNVFGTIAKRRECLYRKSCRPAGVSPVLPHPVVFPKGGRDRIRRTRGLALLDGPRLDDSRSADGPSTHHACGPQLGD